MKSDAHRSSVPESLLFKGRPQDPRLGEWVQLGQFPLQCTTQRENILLWGCPDDTGVVRNRGRAGAKEGPDSIRKHFYRMAMPMDLPWENFLTLHDFGNLIPGKEIGETHDRCSNEVALLSGSGGTLIALGGGHDFAAPNFMGFMAGLTQTNKNEIRAGLLNVDPHLDVRELEDNLPHSGTPFRQILESKTIAGKSFVEFGARTNRNSRAHYEYCLSNEVAVMTLESLRTRKETIPKIFRETLHDLGKQKTHLAVTFDIDACNDAEGSSAAPVIGFSAQELCRMAELAGRHLKVKFFEIAEVAPPLDPSERSSRIAAEMIYYFLRGRALAQSQSKK